MSISLFVLALWVFLVSSSQLMLSWFTIDMKLVGFVGIAYVLIVVLEALFSGISWRPRFLRSRD